MVPAIILAAGRSTRMGRPKALLPSGLMGEPFVARLARSLLAGGTAAVLVVGREDDGDLKQLVEGNLVGARFVPNPDADRGGQLSSLIAGIEAADEPGVIGVLVTPVDVPRIHPATIAALLAAFHGSPERIVRAVHLGAHGHPVVFPRALFEALRQADPTRGAKSVLQANARAILDLEVPDAAVVDDIDTPGDYSRVFDE